MKKYLVKSLFTMACLALVSLPLAVNAQSSDIALGLRTSSTTVTRGSGVAVYGLVTNTSTQKLRTTVSLSALSPCGIETSLGQVKLALDPGKAVALSVYYPIAADACTGMYAVSITADSSSKGADKTALATNPSVTTYVEVK